MSANTATEKPAHTAEKSAIMSDSVTEQFEQTAVEEQMTSTQEAVSDSTEIQEHTASLVPGCKMAAVIT